MGEDQGLGAIAPSGHMMAGKHISVSHIAGASTKTMLNGGQMGVAVGAAAFLCRKYQASPREVFRQHLKELQAVVGEREPFEDCFEKAR